MRSSSRENPLPNKRGLKLLYRDMAPRAPAMRPLAVHLYDHVALRPDDRVLDIGTGTGVAARLAARERRRVCGVDFSAAMLAHARRTPGVAYFCADAHALPFSDAAFTLVVSAFCFNETHPAAALAEAHRVLQPGGRLALLEWGAVDPLMALVDGTLAAYAAAEPAGRFHAAMRALTARVRPWDREVCGGEDISRLLRAAAFKAVSCRHITTAVPFASVDAFFAHALAWSPRRAELEAMPAPVRARCLRRLRERIENKAPTWRPALFYAEGYK